MTGDDLTGPAWVAGACDARVAAARRARWGFRHETWLADLEDGRRVVVQRRADGSNPEAPDARAVRDRVRAAGIAVPEPVAVHRIGAAVVAVLPFVEGVIAAEMLATDEGAAPAGRACGEMAAGLAAVDPAGLRLPGAWASARALMAAVAEWIAGLEPAPADGTVGRIEHAARRAAREIETSGCRFVHGDLAPVNVLVLDGRPAAALDLDRARRAHPRYDAAWFAWVVSFHHPGTATAAWRAFALASGLGDQPLGAVAWLWPLLLLERAAEALDAAERARWSERLAALPLAD